MEFSDLYFLYIWLPLLMAAYFLARQARWKNYILTGFSLLFYAMGQLLYLPLLMGLTYFNFRQARQIRPGDRQSLLWPVALNVAVLVLFKYLDFFLGMFGLSTADGLMLGMLRGLVRGLNAIGFDFREPSTVLPMGISFFTFSMISYLADVYRGRVEPEDSFKRLLMYVCLFPKMLQGPIVRYGQIRFQLSHRRSDGGQVFEGLLRFVLGLSKKVLLADYCGQVIADVTSLGSQNTFVGAWLCAAMFMFQIYFDFSGYSDMAIGLGRVFGFSFCENFDLPYTARSVSEFWRRWHMSLGTFFRDYVYIPLGGNRLGFRRQLLNLLAVWALTGLWHGASWNYVLWGLYFFGLLAAEKHWQEKIRKIHPAGRHAITLVMLLLGWVIFSHEDLGALGSALAGMIGFGGFTGTGVGLKLLNSLPLMAVCALGCTGLPRRGAAIWRSLCGMDREDGEQVTTMKLCYLLSAFGLMMLLLWLCTVSLVGNTSAPSIYGNF